MKVLDLPELDCPRERLLSRGAAALSDRELLMHILGSGVPGCDAIELAAMLIGESGGLPALATTDPTRSSDYRASDPRRRPASPPCSNWPGVLLPCGTGGGSSVPPTSPQPPPRICAASGTSGSSSSRATTLVVCSASPPPTDGSADRSLIPFRDVLTAVLAVGGTSFAVAHNHPSGSLTPSGSDAEATARLRQAASTIGLRFLDHIILTETAWARVP